MSPIPFWFSDLVLRTCLVTLVAGLVLIGTGFVFAAGLSLLKWEWLERVRKRMTIGPRHPVTLLSWAAFAFTLFLLGPIILIHFHGIIFFVRALGTILGSVLRIAWGLITILGAADLYFRTYVRRRVIDASDSADQRTL